MRGFSVTDDLKYRHTRFKSTQVNHCLPLTTLISNYELSKTRTFKKLYELKKNLMLVELGFEPGYSRMLVKRSISEQFKLIQLFTFDYHPQDTLRAAQFQFKLWK